MQLPLTKQPGGEAVAAVASSQTHRLPAIAEHVVDIHEPHKVSQSCAEWGTGADAGEHNNGGCGGGGVAAGHAAGAAAAGAARGAHTRIKRRASPNTTAGQGSKPSSRHEGQEEAGQVAEGSTSGGSSGSSVETVITLEWRLDTVVATDLREVPVRRLPRDSHTYAHGGCRPSSPIERP